MTEPAGNPPLERRAEWRMTGIIFFGLIALIVLWAAFKILRPFLTPILLAAILVVLTFPTYRRVRDKLLKVSAVAVRKERALHAIVQTGGIGRQG